MNRDKPQLVDFDIPKRLEQEYERAIRTLIGTRFAPLKNETFADWYNRVSALEGDEAIREIAERLAIKMVDWTNVVNARTWRSAAERTTGSRKLYAALRGELRGVVGYKARQIVNQNARLITSIPRKTASHITHKIFAAQQAGARPETIAKMMRVGLPKLMTNEIKLTARTETAKASSALTRARADELNLPFYIWLTSEDQRVRRSHRLMDGIVVPYSQAPSPEALAGEKSTLGHYHAGEAPNCRCTQIVVLSYADLRFPIRIYWGGRIQRMLLRDFKQIAGTLAA